MRALLLVAALALAACADAPAPWPADGPEDFVLLGEQHDARGHPELQRRRIRELQAQGRLAGVALEMAESGRSTRGLPANADEARVREALDWNDAAWPWTRYGPVVMDAVRAGVPVWGANLPRIRMREAMQDASLDQRLSPAGFARQEAALREGHCGLLPDAQLRPMARVQVARDLAMATTLDAMRVGGRTVLLIAGAGHVEPGIGIPMHLARGHRWRAEVLPAEPSATDHCEALRRQLAPAPAPGAAR